MIPTPLQNAECLFLAKENQTKVGYAALAVVEADKLVQLCKDFLSAGYHLEDVSGLVSADGAVSMYHFAHFDIPGRASVMVIAPLDAPAFPSISSVYQGAEWHERETRDFFGFMYEGNPNFIPLLLAENMPDVHPLLKGEGDLVPLSAIFSAPGREREVVKRADGFTLLDAPQEEEKKAVPAGEAPKPAAPKESPKEAPAAETKGEPAPEAKPESKPEPASEAPKTNAAAVPEATVSEKEPEPADKAVPVKADVKTKGSSQPSDKKAPASKKTVKAASGKKGDGNA